MIWTKSKYFTDVQMPYFFSLGKNSSTMKWLTSPSKFLFIFILSAFTFASCNDDDDEDSGPSSTNDACFTVVRSGSVFNFDASCSINAVNYTWNFGNGDEVSQIVPTVSYTYPEGGTYTVTLLVEFENGQSQSTTEQVSIEEICLICTCLGPDVGGFFEVECGTDQSVLEVLCSPLCSSMSSGENICSCSYE